MNKVVRFFTDPRTIASFAIYLALIAYGLMSAEFGPALSHISNQTESELGEVSLIFTSRSVGYLIGCVSAGPVFDKITKECILLGVAMMIAGIVNCIIPFIHKIIWLYVISVVQGYAFGALDTIAIVCIILLHGDKAAPWTQALCFSFALGSTVSPLIIGAVIDEYDDIIVSFITIGVIGTIFGLLLCFSPPFKQHNKDKDKNKDKDNTEEEEEEGENMNKPLLENEIDGVVSDNTESQSDSKENAENPLDKKTMKPGIFWTITVIVTIFVCMYTAIESTYGSFLATYATDVGTTTSAGASYMTSCFWGAFAVGRFVGIPITLFISAETYLMIVLILGAVFIAPNMFFTQPPVVWATVVLRGLLIAPTWATAWSVLGNKIELNGKVGTVIIASGSVSQIIFPALCGFLIEKYGPIVLPAQQFACSCMELIIYAILLAMLYYLKHRNDRKKEDLTIN